MPLPPAKRRRIEAANATLRQPFKSPVIKGRSKLAPSPSSVERAVLDRAGPAATTSKVERRPGPRRVAASSPETPSAGTVAGRPRKVDRPPEDEGGETIPEGPRLACQRRCRELEARNQRVKKEIARLRGEAQSAPTRAAKETNDEDGEDGLDGLIEKWKAAAQQAAEELYESSKSRVQSMGGLKEIAAMQRRKRAEFFEDLQAESRNRGDADDEEGESDHGEVSYTPGGTQPEGGSSQEEKEYNMAAMLRSLNIDFAVIGYDETEETWG